MLQEKLTQIGDEQCYPTAVIVSDSEILLGIRNYDYGFDKLKTVSMWALPSWRCDRGETFEQTLRREVEEEVGITELEIYDYIGEAPGTKEGETMYIFSCAFDQDFQPKEPKQFSEWCWVRIEDYLAGEPYDVMNHVAHKLINQYLRTEFTL